MNRTIGTLLGAGLLAGALSLTGGSIAGAAHDGDLQTRLKGEAEVPGPGDPDATGLGFITFDEGKDTICYLVSWKRMQKATAAHIHEGSKTEAGPVVVTLFGEDADIRRRAADGCVVVSHSLWQAIQDNPEDYYINVHNKQYPKGAIRGQLQDDQ